MFKNKINKYNLFLTERIFSEETLASFYFKASTPPIKKTKPINIEGERKRLNLETGEITSYTKKDFLNSDSANIRRTRILMNMMLDMNTFDWFCTLTFDKRRVNRADDEAVYNCYVKYIHNLKAKFPKLKYMTFPERHIDGCIHFHILLAGLTANELNLVNSGKVCCHWAYKKKGICSMEYYEKTKEGKELKDTDGLIVYNITSFIYGITTATRIKSREKCNSYVKKYVDKALGCTDIFKKRFYYSSNLNVPEIVKRMIGADFDTPRQIDSIVEVMNNDLVKFGGKPKISEYNVLQTWINNKTKEEIIKEKLSGQFIYKQQRM